MVFDLSRGRYDENRKMLTVVETLTNLRVRAIDTGRRVGESGIADRECKGSATPN